MKMLNILLSLAIVVTFGYTQCTGGILSIGSAMAAMGSMPESTMENVLMSVERNLCDVSEEEQKVHASDQWGQGGCSGGNCIEKGGDSTSRYRLAKGHHDDPLDTAPVETFFAYALPGENRVSSHLALRSSPLFADAHIYVQSIAKKE